MTPSSKRLVALALCLASSFTPILSSARAGEGKPVLLLIDDSLLKVSGRLETLAFEQAAIAYSPDDGKPQAYLSREQMATRAVVNVPVHVPSVPGMSAGQAAGAGLVGGLIAGAIIEASLLNSRNEEIEGLRTALNAGVLRKEALLTLDSVVTEQGYTVVKKAVSPSVQPGLIMRALGKESVDWAVLVSSAGPIASVTRDNARPLLMAKVSLLRRQGRSDRFKAVSEHQLAYLAEPVPEGQQASAWWSANGGQRYLEQVRTSLRLMATHALDQANWNANEHAVGRPVRDKDDHSLVVGRTVEGRAFVDAGDGFSLILPLPAAPAVQAVAPAAVAVEGAAVEQAAADSTEAPSQPVSAASLSPVEAPAPAEPAR